MKKLIFLTLVLVAVVSCKKIKTEPFGPTDIRIRNITTLNMNNVTVNTYDSTYNYGTVNSNSVSEYHQFDRAYPKANISAIINGQKYKTDSITSYAYMQYMGQMKATYEIWIEGNKLTISKVIPDSQIK